MSSLTFRFCSQIDCKIFSRERHVTLQSEGLSPGQLFGEIIPYLSLKPSIYWTELFLFSILRIKLVSLLQKLCLLHFEKRWHTSCDIILLEIFVYCVSQEPTYLILHYSNRWQLVKAACDHK